MLKLFVFTIASAVALGGCTSVSGNKNEPTGLKDKVVYGTQATIGQCPHDLAESSVLASIGASIVGKGVNRIGQAIVAASQTETTQILVRRNIELNSEAGLGPCLLVARGWFYRSKSTEVDTYQRREDAGFQYESSISAIRNQGLNLAATPDFFFEGKFIASLDESAISLAPAYVFMGTPITSNILRPSSERSILLAFAFTKPAAAQDLTKGQGSTLVVGRLKSGMSVSYSLDEAEQFTYVCKSGIGVCPDKAPPSILIRGPQESEWFSLSLSDKVQPMTLQVLISETRDASKFLGFVGEVFADVQPDFTTALKQALIPSFADVAEETEQAANEKRLSEYDTAYGDAISKLSACIQAPMDSVKIASAKVAMRVANQKARLAELAQPFSESQVNDIPLGAAIDATLPCTSALGN